MKTYHLWNYCWSGSNDNKWTPTICEIIVEVVIEIYAKFDFYFKYINSTSKVKRKYCA